MHKFDCIVIGGGIVGLSVAWTLLKQRPGIRIAVLEILHAIHDDADGAKAMVIGRGQAPELYGMSDVLADERTVKGHELVGTRSIWVRMLMNVENLQVRMKLPGVRQSVAYLSVLFRGSSNGLGGGPLDPDHD